MPSIISCLRLIPVITSLLILTGAGTITPSSRYLLQRSATTIDCNLSVEGIQDCTNQADCLVKRDAAIAKESKEKTTGSVTYQCVAYDKATVSFYKPIPPPDPTPEPPVLNVATLRWTPPTQNTDGSALTNLAGYRIVYGRAPDSLTAGRVVTGASTTTYTLEGLTQGAWYFAVVAVTSTGVESALSNIATKTIPG